MRRYKIGDIFCADINAVFRLVIDFERYIHRLFVCVTATDPKLKKFIDLIYPNIEPGAGFSVSKSFEIRPGQIHALLGQHDDVVQG